MKYQIPTTSSWHLGNQFLVVLSLGENAHRLENPPHQSTSKSFHGTGIGAGDGSMKVRMKTV
jgi:hypothetical protein